MQLRKSTVNTNVPLTLEEKTTLTGTVYYLFEFENDTTKTKYYQIFTDISVAGVARQNSNLFNIEVINSGSGANKIILGNVGQYHYTIYQQASSTNLDPDLASGIVERGMMWLSDATDRSIYIQHEIEVTYIAHEQ